MIPRVPLTACLAPSLSGQIIVLGSMIAEYLLPDKSDTDLHVL